MANQAPRRVSDLPPENPQPEEPQNSAAQGSANLQNPPAPPQAPQSPEQLDELHRLNVQRSIPERKPFGAQEYKLSGYPTDPNCVPRWFNDTPGRILRALRAGYRHVKDPESGKNVDLTVGTAERGGGQVAFLMEIPKQYYREDFAAKQANLDLTDAAIMRGKHKAEPGDKRYGEVNMRVTGNARPRVPMAE